MNPGNIKEFGLNDSSAASPLHLLKGTGGRVDVNCDMGEGISNGYLPAERDELLMQFISSANIACGYHAGDATTIKQTIALCIKYNVSIGAHPSFYDRNNFGRKEMVLPVDDLYDLITRQLMIFSEVADSVDQKINHVKPHGALYNMSAKDASIANVIAKAVRDFDSTLVLFGLSGSNSISQANAIGLKTASEVFADRTYQDDGSLTPRSQPDALIEDTNKAVQQVLQMVKEGTVSSVSGKTVHLVAETICIHGDGKHAAVFGRVIYENLKQNNIEIKALWI